MKLRLMSASLNSKGDAGVCEVDGVDGVALIHNTSANMNECEHELVRMRTSANVHKDVHKNVHKNVHTSESFNQSRHLVNHRAPTK